MFIRFHAFAANQISIIIFIFAKIYTTLTTQLINIVCICFFQISRNDSCALICRITINNSTIIYFSHNFKNYLSLKRMNSSGRCDNFL